MKKLSLLLSLMFSIMLAAVSQAATFDDVKARGTLLCGVNTGLLGLMSTFARRLLLRCWVMLQRLNMFR
jgi:general L-amino acid transport system substrate-binding protein